ncbi:MAG: hypothetical protein JST16_06530 [Bdellovibrionales bacterium]|nr:hypothetical protein [Bdellovibrionales bacterium]
MTHQYQWLLLSAVTFFKPVYAQDSHPGDIAADEAVAPAAAKLLDCPGYDPQNDPFSFNTRFTKGPNAGQCIDMRVRRPIVTLTPEQVKRYLPNLKLNPGDQVLANVSDDTRNYYAVIPANAVENIVVQKELFDPAGVLGKWLNHMTGFSAHMQSRFIMKDGKEVTLIPQNAQDRAKGVPQRTLKQLVVSSEALTRASGDSFDLVKGLKDSFAVATRVTTLEAKKTKMIESKHRIQQFEVNPVVNTQRNPSDTPDSVRQKYFQSALSQSSTESQQFAAGTPLMYNTLERSCFTRGFAFYDAVNNYNVEMQAMSDAFKRNPMALREYLLARGMLTLDPAKQWPDFAVELKNKGSNFVY